MREGLDRILQAKRGALVVIGDDPAVLVHLLGGFLLDAEFSPQRLSELAKMDGAIILAADASRIARANVHLMPKASIPTSETGTRHRTAERVARSIDVPVVSVSEAMATIAVYRNDAQAHGHEHGHGWWIGPARPCPPSSGSSSRFDLALASLSTLEVEDTVSVRDVVAVLQPGEMVRPDRRGDRGLPGRAGRGRTADPPPTGRARPPVSRSLELVVRDYLVDQRRAHVPVRTVTPDIGRDDGAGHEAVRASTLLGPGSALPDSPRPVLGAASVDEVMAVLRRLSLMTFSIRCGSATPSGWCREQPRWTTASRPGVFACCTACPEVLRCHHRTHRRAVRHPASDHAGVASGDLEKVGGVGAAKARSVKDGLARLAEASIFERYD